MSDKQEAPEAPVWYTHEEAVAWENGWTSGYKSSTHHIRAALFDELIAKSAAKQEKEHYYWGYEDVTGWIIEQKEQEQP